MNYAQIIAKSFRLGTDVPKLRWFVFIPNIISITILMLQTALSLYMYFDEFQIIDVSISLIDMMAIIFQYILENNLIAVSLLGVAVAVMIKFVFPPLIEGVLLVGVRDKLEDQDIRMSLRKKIVQGGGYYFKLFELNAALSAFSFLSMTFGPLAIYRYHHDTAWLLMKPLVIGYIILGIIVNLITCYSAFFLVYEDGNNLATAIRKSATMVFLNIGQTLAVALIMLLVNVRVLINVFVVFGVPLGIMGVFSVYANSIAMWLAVGVGGLLLVLAAYLTAVLDVFSTFVWAQAFFAMKDRMENLESKK